MSIKSNKWSSLTKIGFRFFFCYFVLFIAFQNNSTFPFWSVIFSYPIELSKTFIPWLGEHLFRLDQPVYIGMTGSGDTTYDFLILFCILVVSVCLTAIWSLIDKKRDNYHKLYYWLTVVVRFFVALMLINYGFSKIIKLQFPYPGPYRLIETYGESSPMGLAWTFLGLSKGYNLFMGVAEMLSVLLLFRRTLTIGALITLMTALNVMAINYFYDVPVKIISTHLVLMCLFLLLPNIKSLMHFFFNSAQTKLENLKRPRLKKNYWLALDVLKAALIAYVFIYGYISAADGNAIYGADAPKPELYGIYEVKDFIINGDTITNYKNEKLWKSIAVQWEGSLQVRRFSGSKLAYYGIEKDSLAENRMRLTRWGKVDESFVIDYKKMDTIGLELKFIKDQDTVYASFERYNPKDYLLNKRGFHWISEQAYNR